MEMQTTKITAVSLSNAAPPAASSQTSAAPAPVSPQGVIAAPGVLRAHQALRRKLKTVRELAAELIAMSKPKRTKRRAVATPPVWPPRRKRLLKGPK